jgi:hypothetical protein
MWVSYQLSVDAYKKCFILCQNGQQDPNVMIFLLLQSYHGLKYFGKKVEHWHSTEEIKPSHYKFWLDKMDPEAEAIREYYNKMSQLEVLS